jgi:lysophospholipase L1-like esterase
MIDASYEPNAPQTFEELPLQLALGDVWAVGGPGPLPDAGGYVAQLSGALGETYKTGIRLVNIGKAAGTTNNPATLANLSSNRLPYALDLVEHWDGLRQKISEPLLITVHTGFDVRFVRPSTPASQVPQLLVSQAGNAFAAAENDWAGVRGNLDAVLSTLRQSAPRTRIVIGTYDNPYRSCNLPLGRPETEALVAGYLEGGNGFVKGLNDVIREVAKAHDVSVAEVYGALGADDWAPDCDRPSASGQDEVADAFAEAIKCGGAGGNNPGSRICSFRGH